MKVQHFHKKLPCQNPVLRQTKWGEKNDLSYRMDFSHLMNELF